MVILQIISLCALALLIVLVAILLIKKPASTSAITMKEYMELRAYIQMCFDEQNKLNTKINELIIHSMESNNNTVINAVSKNETSQVQKAHNGHSGFCYGAYAGSMLARWRVGAQILYC